MSKKRIAIIGAGFAGMSAAAFLAKEGFKVTLLERHSIAGGRARKFSSDGFTFDLGPSWVWMPEVFEKFYKNFGHTTSDFYTLERLDPSYRIYWSDTDFTDVPAQINQLKAWFDSLEPNAGVKLDKFLNEAKYKYNVGINDLVYKPGRSIIEFANYKTLSGLLKMDILSSFARHIRSYFKHPKILQFLEFPILFLGALPENTPALYSLMNYADISLGTWYPQGGMYKIVEAFEKICLEQGVEFVFNAKVNQIAVRNGKATTLFTSQGSYEVDYVLGGADYHHIEQELLPTEARSYSQKYWESRVMAPSALLYYIGINKKLDGMRHHTLLFDRPFKPHAESIYTTKTWPTDPSIYLSCTSVTDPTVAPEGHENLMVLIPVAPGLTDTPEVRKHYLNVAIDRIAKITGNNIANHIVFEQSMAQSDFISQYGAFKGNAYGLANTLMQTAILKPSIKSKKVDNLYYTGQLTVPGPGVPPTIISGEVAAKQIIKHEARL